MALLHPESDLSMSSVAMGGSLLHIMSERKKPIIVDELMEKFLRADRRRTQVNFFSALYFLYMLGAIDKVGYRVKIVPPAAGDTLQGELGFTD